MVWVVNNNIPLLSVAGLTVARGSGQRIACPARPSLAARFGVTMGAIKRDMMGAASLDMSGGCGKIRIVMEKKLPLLFNHPFIKLCQRYCYKWESVG